MRICILALDQHVAQVRQTAIDNGINLPGLLAIPVSESGEEPAQAWFCNFKVNEEMKDKLFSLKNLSIMEENESTTNFLKKKNMKFLKKK